MILLWKNVSCDIAAHFGKYRVDENHCNCVSRQSFYNECRFLSVGFGPAQILTIRTDRSRWEAPQRHLSVRSTTGLLCLVIWLLYTHPYVIHDIMMLIYEQQTCMLCLIAV